MGITVHEANGSLTISDALFSSVQQRVLAVLFSNPGRSFFGGEIIRLASSGSGAVQRELAKLEASRLVTTERVGRQKHYRANALSPVYEELRSLILKTSGLADQIRSALAPRAAEVRLAFIYGSVAKNTDSPTSDIDLLVVSDTIAYAELFVLLEPATQALGRPINPTLYTEDELRARTRKKNAFIVRVLQQPKLWVIGSDDDVGT